VNAQLSKVPLSTFEGTILATPLTSKSIVMFLVITVGAMLSWTVTIAVWEALFPLTSITVKITVLSPTLVQSKEVISNEVLVILQLSKEPLSISEGIILATPFAFSSTTIFLVITVGAILSCTVTVAVWEALFPLISTTVKVTVLLPIVEQSNVVVSKANETPQASFDPLSTSEGTILAAPLTSNWTVMSCAMAIGAITSLTVTVACAIVDKPCDPS